MKIDRSKLKKGNFDVPAECKILIEKISSCKSNDELLTELKNVKSWVYGKCELLNWVDVLDILDDVLEACSKPVQISSSSSSSSSSPSLSWHLACNPHPHHGGQKDKELLLVVLHFSSLLIEHSFTRHLYNSMEHLTALLAASDMTIVLAVIDVLYVFSKRSNFITRLPVDKKQILISRLLHLAESWGGKENGFGLSACCQDLPMEYYPASATTLHFEYYDEVLDITSKKGPGPHLQQIHLPQLDRRGEDAATIMMSIVCNSCLPKEKEMQLFTHIRLALSFSNYEKRLQCVQARLQALSTLIYSNAAQDHLSSLLYSGFIEELVDVLELDDQLHQITDIKATSLRTLTAVVHLEGNRKLSQITQATGTSLYHGFLPVLMRKCIQHMTDPDLESFPHSLTTALFSFLYHLASYESGGEALVSCGIMESLLKVVAWHGDDSQDHITFVTRAVRVVDLMTNLDMQTFQSYGAMNIFVNRLQHEVDICRREQPFVFRSTSVSESHQASESMGSSPNPYHSYDWSAADAADRTAVQQDDSHMMQTSTHSQDAVDATTRLPGTGTTRQCFPQRAALLKSMLNFLKKTITDASFADASRHLMDGPLPYSLKHIISNAEYYGPSLFLLATELVTVYVFQEPSMLSSLQSNGLTDVMLQALLVKDVPATKEVLSALPNVFSALCLNTRGLNAFMACKPFDNLFKVLLSPDYLPAMRRRRSSDLPGDTATSLGSAVDELMRHQPSLRTDAIKGIIKLLVEVSNLGQDPDLICQKANVSINMSTSTATPAPATNSTNNAQQNNNSGNSSDDEDDEDDVASIHSSAGVGGGASTEGASNKSPTRENRVDHGSKDKQSVPLVDYVLNVMKFVEAILSNNTTDDHCREFVHQEGLKPLLNILILPNLPVDFPSSASCLAVASVCKSILTLTRDPQVLRSTLELTENLLSCMTDLMYSLNNESPAESVLFKELISAILSDHQEPFRSKQATPLLHYLTSIHSCVAVFISICKVTQGDIRTITLNHWSSSLGMQVLSKLSMLYTSLVWESSMLIGLCGEYNTPPSSNEPLGIPVTRDGDVNTCNLNKLIHLIVQGQQGESEDAAASAAAAAASSLSFSSSQPTSSLTQSHPLSPANNLPTCIPMETNQEKNASEQHGMSAMDVDAKAGPQGQHRTHQQQQQQPPMQSLTNVSNTISVLIRAINHNNNTLPASNNINIQTRTHILKPLLAITSKLGRSLTELFNLLARTCVGTPSRPRRTHHQTNASSLLPSPSPIARTVSKQLSLLLNSGLLTFPAEGGTVWRLRLTFLICSIGFTSSMLFDDKKFPYHLMLQEFVSAGGIEALYQTFMWVLCDGGTLDEQTAMNTTKLSEGSSEFFDAWLTLMDRMLNPKNLIESPYSMPPKTTANYFDPLVYLAQIEKMGFDAITYLWNKELLNFHGHRICEAMLNIICYIVKTEAIIKNRMNRDKQVQPGVEGIASDQLNNASIGHDATDASNAGLVAGPSSAANDSLNAPTIEESGVDENYLQQLMDMGFSRAHATQALLRCDGLEQATEYCLFHPPPAQSESASEEDQMIRAIAMSLGEDVDEKSPSANKVPQKTATASTASSAAAASDANKNVLTKEIITDFTSNIMTGCLRLLDALPGCVYRVSDVLIILTERNGEAWTNAMFFNIISQIKTCCMYLVEKASPMSTGDQRSVKEWADQLSTDQQANQLAVRLHLLSLLFEGLKFSCVQSLEDPSLLDLLVKLLYYTQQCLSAAPQTTTPKWVASLLLMLDLYEKMSLATKKRATLEKLLGGSHTWKWFDDRSGKWSNYGAGNNRTIDDAYWEGQTSVKFTAGRRRYMIQFNTMIQVNEETGNKRPIMLHVPQKQEIIGQAGTNISSEKTTTTAEVVKMDVTPSTASSSSSSSQKASQHQQPKIKEEVIITGLSPDQVDCILRSCIGLIGCRADGDTLHACMRLVLRLTRDYTFSKLFVTLGGPKLLLLVDESSNFQGFLSLATLILRHAIEDEQTLKYAMEKIVRSSTLGAGSNACGVAMNSNGSKEMHYLLRVLGPAVCRDETLFKLVATNVLRINVPPIKRDDDEARVLNPANPQLLKSLPVSSHASPPVLGELAKEVVFVLLQALANNRTTTADQQQQQSSTAAADVEQTQQQQQATQPQQQQTAAASKMSNKPLMSRSSIMRLLAELVRSYVGCALFIVNQSFKACEFGPVTEDCTVLSYILDHLIHRGGTEHHEDPHLPSLSRLLLTSIASSNHSPDAQNILANELKASLQRSLIMHECNEKHCRIQAITGLIATIIEACPSAGSAGRFDQVRSQLFRPMNTMNNMVKIMVKKGLVNDLARVTHNLDLSSPNMAATVNAALKPLETLSRIVNQPHVAANNSAATQKSGRQVAALERSGGANNVVGAEGSAAPRQENAEADIERDAMNNEGEMAGGRQDAFEDEGDLMNNDDSGEHNNTLDGDNERMQPMMIDTIETGHNDDDDDDAAHLTVYYDERASNVLDIDDEDDVVDEDDDDDNGGHHTLEPEQVQERRLDAVLDTLLERGTSEGPDVIGDIITVSVDHAAPSTAQNPGGAVEIDIELTSSNDRDAQVVIQDMSENEDDDDEDDDVDDDDDDADQNNREGRQNNEQWEGDMDDDDQDEQDDDDEDGDDDDDDDDVEDDEQRSIIDDEEDEEFIGADYEENQRNNGGGVAGGVADELMNQWEDALPGNLLLENAAGAQVRTYHLPIAMHDTELLRDPGQALPPAPSGVMVNHPLLARNQETSQHTTYALQDGAVTPRLHRSNRARQTYRYNPSTQTLHVQYARARHVNPPAILQRLLGATTDVMQLTNSLTTGGSTRLHLMSGDELRVITRVEDESILDSLFQQTELLAEDENNSIGLLSDIPAALTRWAEESKVLEGEVNMHETMLIAKVDIMHELEKFRDEEVKEQREKRMKDKWTNTSAPFTSNKTTSTTDAQKTGDVTQTPQQQQPQQQATISPSASSSNNTKMTSTHDDVAEADDVDPTLYNNIDNEKREREQDLDTQQQQQQQHELIEQQQHELIEQQQQLYEQPQEEARDLTSSIFPLTGVSTLDLPTLHSVLTELNELAGVVGGPTTAAPATIATTSTTDTSTNNQLVAVSTTISTTFASTQSSSLSSFSYFTVDTMAALSPSTTVQQTSNSTTAISPGAGDNHFNNDERMALSGETPLLLTYQNVFPPAIDDQQGVSPLSTNGTSLTDELNEATLNGDSPQEVADAPLLESLTTPTNNDQDDDDDDGDDNEEEEEEEEDVDDHHSPTLSMNAQSISSGSTTTSTSSNETVTSPAAANNIPPTEEMTTTASAAPPASTSEPVASTSSQPNMFEDIVLPEGVDPSFLAALPENIRHEVIMEQLRLQRIQLRAQQQQLEAQSLGVSEVSPEFLAALPPNIQEEVLAQQRVEQNRLSQNPETPMDPASFIQSLPSSLRQQVLADMDDSMVAILPADLAAEANVLRRELEDRHRILLQERLFNQGGVLSGILRHPGYSPRNITNASYTLRSLPMRSHWNWSGGGRGNNAAGGAGGTLTAAASNATKIRGKHLLDNEGISCLLVLLFVDDSRLNTTRLHRVVRNLCYHAPTRHWIIEALLSILAKTDEHVSQQLKLQNQLSIEHGDVHAQQQQSCQQPSKKMSSHDPTISAQVSHQDDQTSAQDEISNTPSWLNIYLCAALGSQTNVFRLTRAPTSSACPSRKHSSKHAPPLTISLHPQAAPLICRHVLDILISLAKTFPTHFIPKSSNELQSDGHKPKSTTTANQTTSATTSPPSLTSANNSVTTVKVDFWDSLIKLDSFLANRKGKSSLKDRTLSSSSSSSQHPSNQELSTQQNSSSPQVTSDRSCLGQLMTMLSHPIIRKSQLLTDRLLRLLRLISVAFCDASSVTQQASTTAPPPSSTAASLSTAAVPPLSSAVATATTTSSSATPPLLAGSSSSAGPTAADRTTDATTDENMDTNSDDVQSVVLESELTLVVEVLTSKYCSEEGLEDATNLLLQLAKHNAPTRTIILKLLIQGVHLLGASVCQHIRSLSDELSSLCASEMKEDDDVASSLASTSSNLKGVLQDRYTGGQIIVHVNSATKLKARGRELQLASMQQLTNKTSSQNFLLRLLKVIIHLREAIRNNKKAQQTTTSSTAATPAATTTSTAAHSSLPATTTTTSIATPASTSTLQQQAPPQSSATNSYSQSPMEVDNAATTAAVADADSDASSPSATSTSLGCLTEHIQLDDLWTALEDCLLLLAKMPDNYAVLVLQPAVEAFFLAHAGEKDNQLKRDTSSSRREDQLAHVAFSAPMSPNVQSDLMSPNIIQSETARLDSNSVTSNNTSTTTANKCLRPEVQKFISFAETHRTVLNQILRQSTSPLSEGAFSVLVDYTKVLDFDIKRRYFRHELDRMDEGVRKEDLAVHVRRSHVFEDSFRELHRRTPEEWKNRFYIVFQGEEGQDAGGLLREWYIIISREIFNPMYALFCTSPGDRVTYTINASSHCNSNHLSYFKFVGRIIAKAIYDNKLLECYFTRSFYKHILGVLVKYTDMESEDYAFYKGLVFLMENDVEDLGYELTFSTEIQEFGVTTIRDLKEDGRNIRVTEENKKEYVKLVCQMKMTGAIKQQLTSFLDGFYSIIPKRLISIFNEQELELLISGLPNIDIDDLKANTEIHKYQANALQISWFWRALKSFDQADRARFLQFVTGTSKVPLQGFAYLEGMNGTQKFQIHKDDRSTDRLPSAHTCFNQLDLPVYETYDKLRQMLLLAIHECSEGFGLA